jgi:ABC-type multidrug transport system permease subunit
VMLWLFSTATIMAIGTSALTVFAIFGNGIGALVNTMFFIALAMTSSGGTVPLAATPPFFQWLSEFEPFRAVVDGVRALLYFSGNADAGLAEAWLRVAVGGAIGVLLGVTVTALYGRVRLFSRHPRPEPSTAG